MSIRNDRIDIKLEKQVTKKIYGYDNVNNIEATNVANEVLKCILNVLKNFLDSYRYNHFVPAVQRSDEEVSALMSRCGAADIGACNIHHSDTQQYVQCDDCHRWYHSLCLGDSTRSHTMKRQMSLSCGCLRNGPFRPKRYTFQFDIYIKLYFKELSTLSCFTTHVILTMFFLNEIG